jgi:tight adherence protein C
MDTATLTFIATAMALTSAFLLVIGIFPKKLMDQAEEESGGKNVMSTVKNILIRNMGNSQSRFISTNYREKMKWKFIAMGKPEMLVEDFIVYQEFAAVFFTIFLLIMLNFFHKNLAYCVFGTVLGFIYPFIWLNDQIKKRQKKITRSLPYALDLLTLSVEAGLDFGAAIQTVIDKAQRGPLTEEFALMLSEIRMGRTREESLRNFSKRVQVTSVSAFVTNLVQADRMGTSLGKILRIQSTQMRIERTQYAEKRANEAPVKMLFPLVACIFPTVFMVLFGPIVYTFMSGGVG